MKNVTRLMLPMLLLTAGALLVFIAVFITVSPLDFYAANDIVPGTNPSLRSELKAPAGLLLAAGSLMLLAVFVSSLVDTALLLAALTYLSYAAARYASMLTDGIPAAGLVQAAALEAVIGLACLCAMVLRRVRANAGNDDLAGIG